MFIVKQNVAMPEGPSIYILKELALPFRHKTVSSVLGNTKENKDRLVNEQIMDIKSWGKHFLICFNGFAVRIHFLLFGSYRINEEKETAVRLSLRFDDGTFINFYACSVKFVEGDIDKEYDWSEDIMADEWDAAKAMKKLKAAAEMLACDALLDQHIFAGSGNIIKNEVLYRIKVHPLSIVGKLPLKQLRLLVKETRLYAFDFLKWKKEYELKKHWLAHTKKTCERCNIPLSKAHLGKTNRRTFFCANCQKLYI